MNLVVNIYIYLLNNLINLFPNEISKGSNKIANWKCKYGHIWVAAIHLKMWELPVGDATQ